MPNKDIVDTPPDWAELWAIVGESLLGGVHHALNNRVAALGAISQVLRSGIADAGPLVSSLATEVRQLEETIALLSLLRRARAQRPEPVQLPELAGTLAPLLAQHNDLREVEFVLDGDPGILPAWAERDQLTRVLLTLAVAVGLEAEHGRCRSVGFSFSGDEREVTALVACRASDEGPDPGEGVEPVTRRLDPGAALHAVKHMGGMVETKLAPGGRTAYEVRLPTLLAARKASGME